MHAETYRTESGATVTLIHHGENSWSGRIGNEPLYSEKIFVSAALAAKHADKKVRSLARAGTAGKPRETPIFDYLDCIGHEPIVLGGGETAAPHR